MLGHLMQSFVENLEKEPIVSQPEASVFYPEHLKNCGPDMSMFHKLLQTKIDA